ncbi:MAG: hypothetical protein H7246_02425 [Phycisphaerae bacterium]|nr:hypothetical protein [Saprospiraceae bacterium]
MLTTPARVCNEFVMPDAVWAQYFQENNPSAVLLQAGIRNKAIGSNYLHWSRLPDNFELFLQNAQRVGQGRMPPDYGAKKLEVIWQRFWDGHNKAGFANWLSTAMRTLQIADDKLNKGHQYEQQIRAYLAEADKEQAFQNMQLRWETYKPYLMLAPFFDKIEEADGLLSNIKLSWADCIDYKNLEARIHIFRMKIEALDALLTSLAQYFKTTSHEEVEAR